MSEIFQQALTQTLSALEVMKHRHSPPSASLTSLEQLLTTQPRIHLDQPPSTMPKSPDPNISSSSKSAHVQSSPLDQLREAALACVRCPHLVSSRNGVVFGIGNPSAELLFVGEAPGADEDAQGEPFVGRAGQLLTKIIEAMGLSRETVYIANVLKCRPDMPESTSGNRKPKPEEMRTCLPWLEKQIELIAPKALVALGATAAEGLLETKVPIGELRGCWHEFRGIPTMVTYHPAYLLRNQSISEKRKVWEDMLLVLEKLGHPISAKQRAFFTASSSRP